MTYILIDGTISKKNKIQEVSYGIYVIYSNYYYQYVSGGYNSNRPFGIFQKEIPDQHQKFSDRVCSYVFVCDGARTDCSYCSSRVSCWSDDTGKYSVMINLGLTQMLLEPLDKATRDTLQTAFDALIQTPSWQLALSPVERLAAITAQIGFSVIVWLVAIGITLIAWNIWKKEAGKSM